jgi:hypothetical protein
MLKNITFEKDPLVKDGVLMRVFYPNQSDVQAVSLTCDRKDFFIKEVNHNSAFFDTYFKFEEMMIDDYNEPNCVSVLSESCIYDGEVSPLSKISKVKVSFNYVITDEGCKKNEFNYIGFIPNIDITGLFRVYNTNWHELYYGNLLNKKRTRYGIYNLGPLMIQAFWKENMINGPVRLFDAGVLKFSGRINNLNFCQDTKLDVFEPTTSTGNIIGKIFLV